MRKISLLLVTAMTSLCVNAGLPDPLLVLDAGNAQHLPKKFRTTSDDIKSDKVNTAGLADLHAAGSAQFSEMGLQKALARIHAKQILIIDLRQESHGFLNGNAITWYGKHDAANAGKSPKEIHREETALLKEVSNSKTIKVYNINEKSEDGTILSAKPQEYAVHKVSSEEVVANRNHADYQRIYVQDFHAPDNKAVDRFIKLIKNVPSDKWLYFHCRGGVGRTTSFMVMYDMMRNAKKVSFDDIMERQKLIGGKDLRKFPEEGSWKYQFSVDRLNLLKKFYQYAHDNNDNYETTWEEWLKNNP